MRLIFTFILVMCGVANFAQSYYTERDSIEDNQIMQEFFYKTKFQVTLSHEKTLLTQGVNMKMNVLKIGIQYKKNYKMGMFFGISKAYRTYEPEASGVSYYETNVGAFGGYFEYVIIEDYRWYLGTPLSFGRGRVLGEAYNSNDNSVPNHDWESENFGMFSFGVNGGYNINYWLTLSGGLGYRFISNASANTDANFNTLYYTYGVKFKLGHLVTNVFHRKRVNKMRSIYFRNKDSWSAKRFKNKHPEFYK
ncbi:MAG: hypothetical protein ACPGRC_09555 [Salibacteraceae bacterium]